MATQIASHETRTYKRGDARAEIERWSRRYPWYKAVVEDIRDTLHERDMRSGETEMPQEVKATGLVRKLP